MKLPAEMGDWQPAGCVDNAAVPERKGDIDQLFSFWSNNALLLLPAHSWLFFLLLLVAWNP